MADLEIICPHCEQSLNGTRDMLGCTIECPSCGGPITLPRFPSSQFGPPPLPGGARLFEPMAIVSLIMGLVSFVVGPLSIIVGPVAVACGEVARKRVRRSRNTWRGEGMALAGRIFGVLGFFFGLLMIPACINFMYWW